MPAGTAARLLDPAAPASTTRPVRMRAVCIVYLALARERLTPSPGSRWTTPGCRSRGRSSRSTGARRWRPRARTVIGLECYCRADADDPVWGLDDEALAAACAARPGRPPRAARRPRARPRLLEVVRLPRAYPRARRRPGRRPCGRPPSGWRPGGRPAGARRGGDRGDRGRRARRGGDPLRGAVASADGHDPTAPRCAKRVRGAARPRARHRSSPGAPPLRAATARSPRATAAWWCCPRRPPRWSPACASRASWACPVVPRGSGTGPVRRRRAPRRRDRAVGRADDAHPRGRPDGALRAGGARRAEPRPVDGGAPPGPALRARPLQPAGLLDRRQRRHQRRRPALPGVRGHRPARPGHGDRARRRRGAAPGRHRPRPARLRPARLRGGRRGHARRGHRGDRAPHAHPAPRCARCCSTSPRCAPPGEAVGGDHRGRGHPRRRWR